MKRRRGMRRRKNKKNEKNKKEKKKMKKGKITYDLSFIHQRHDTNC